MLNGFSFQTLGLRGSEKKRVEELILKNGGSMKRMVINSSEKQIVVFSLDEYTSKYTLSRAYQWNVPVIELNFLESYCLKKSSAQRVDYQTFKEYSKLQETNFKKRKRCDEQEHEEIFDRKIGECINYSEFTLFEVDIEAERKLGELSTLQHKVKDLNQNFNRWDLDETQLLFFSQFLVELDKDVLEFPKSEKKEKEFAQLERIFEHELNQPKEDSFLKSINKTSPYSVFFKLNNHLDTNYWESTIQSIIRNLFFPMVSFEKQIIFGTSEQFLSESLTKRAAWFQEHIKHENNNKLDLLPYYYLNRKDVFGDGTFNDTFFVGHMQRYELENEDVFLHKGICHLVLNMRCLLKNWIDRLSRNRFLSCENMEKIRIFGSLVAGTTIVWLEMRLKFHTEFDIVGDQSLPPFTYVLKVSDIYDLTTVQGLSKSLMIIQSTFDQVNNLQFVSEPLECSNHSILDTLTIYNSIISGCSFDKISFRNAIDKPDESKIVEVYNIPTVSETPTNEVIDSVEGDSINLASFLKEAKLDLVEEYPKCQVTAVELVFRMMDGIPFCLASITGGRISLLFLDRTRIDNTPIAFVCKHNSMIKYIMLKPTNDEAWKLAIEKITMASSLVIGGEDNNVTVKNCVGSIASTSRCFEEENVQLKKGFDQIVNGSSTPSLFSILGCSARNLKYSIHCEPHPLGRILIVLETKSHPHYPGGVFIKLTRFYSSDNPDIMKYLQNVSPIVKLECKHIAQVFEFKMVDLKDNHQLYLALYNLVKHLYGDKVSRQLDLNNFNSRYAKEFFTFKNPIQVSYLECLQPLNVKDMITKMKLLELNTAKIKLLITIRWIGQCITILDQLHSKLNILHCDISFDNILTRKSTGSDTVGQLILNESNNRVDNYDLVISDLNTAYQLKDNSSDYEERKAITTPDTIKFPYTWHTYEFYGSMQADNYAMAIFIAKLVRRFMFEDFQDFQESNVTSTLTFMEYGKSVITYFEKLQSEDNTEPIFKEFFLPELVQLLKYIIYQNRNSPSLLSNITKIYQRWLIMHLNK